MPRSRSPFLRVSACPEMILFLHLPECRADGMADVWVLDIVMPEMNGIQAAYEIHHLTPAPKTVFISSHYTPQESAMLTRLFGDGNFVPKSEAGKSLIPGVRRLLPEECRAKAAMA